MRSLTTHPDHCFLVPCVLLMDSGEPGQLGRVLGLPHLGEEFIREEQKQCGEVTVKDLNKEEPRTFLRLSSEALNPKDKRYQEAT